jgi:hypothetical protein
MACYSVIFFYVKKYQKNHSNFKKGFLKMKLTSILKATAVIAVVLFGNVFSQNWSSGTGYIYNSGGDVRVSGNRYTQSGDSAAISFGDIYGRIATKWGLGMFFSVYGNPNLLTLSETGNVGIGTTTPNSMLTVNGSLGLKTRTMTEFNDTVGIWNNTVIVMTSGYATLELPAASSMIGRVYYIFGCQGDLVHSSTGWLWNTSDHYAHFNYSDSALQIIATSNGWAIIVKNNISFNS